MSNHSVTTPSGEFEGLKKRAAAALTGMELLREALHRKVEELMTADVTAMKPAEVAILTKELGKAVTVATEQEGKLADALRTEHGGDGLDLAQARAEIGRRLDRIRDAGRSERVSG